MVGLRTGVARRTLVNLDALVDSRRSPSLFSSREVCSVRDQRAPGEFGAAGSAPPCAIQAESLT
eukprot:5392797-Pleurochrysis_carterae.AAC.1